MSRIPFIDLQAQRDRIRPQIDVAIKKVLNHGRYIMGPEVFELEARLAEYVGVKHCVSCASGTDALLMALMAYRVGPGDAIFTTPFTFVATCEMVSLLGATPVFVDIDSRTYNIDPQKLEKALANFDQPLTPRGIIPVDLFGLPADYGAIMAVAGKHGLFVIEDAAQSFGATYMGRRAGGLADMAATSFFPAKPLSCFGDGGAVFTDDDNFAQILQSIRVHGKGQDKYDNIRIGLNARLDTIQAAILLEKLKIYPEEFEARQRVADTYKKLLSELNNLWATTRDQQIISPYVPEGYASSWAQYSILTANRASLQQRLQKHGVPTAIYYSKPLYLQPAFSGLNYRHGDFPETEWVAEKILSLPMHPYLKAPAQVKILQALGR